MNYLPTIERSLNGGTQKVYRFPNNMGASVVRHSFSYGRAAGLWELAVIKFTGADTDDFVLDYSTHITDDAIGNLNEDEVQALLVKIEAL
jgi:hypothetical protein